MRIVPFFTCCAVLAGCARAPAPPRAPANAPPLAILIRGDVDRSDLEAAVGKWVRVEGVLPPYNKSDQIAGVDVEVNQDLRGKRAWAEGVLQRHVEGTGASPDGPMQSRHGTFYRLVDPATGQIALARPLHR